MFNPYRVRDDFPIFKRRIRGKPIIYLDSTATSQKPIQVIEALSKFYMESYANIHRGLYDLSQEASEMYEEAHVKVAKLINADGMEEVVFVRNTTEAINLVAYSWALNNLNQDDEILLTIMEHHSNIVPWQLIAKKRNVKLKYVDIDDDGRLKIQEFEEKISSKTRLIAVTHVSNVLGTVNDVKRIGKLAHEVNAFFLVDGAQSVPHMPVNVKDIDCDFLAFSGHKMLAPTGIGVLYARKDILSEMDPFMGGGDMISDVDLYESKWAGLPWKFEAGTSSIADGIALGVAVDYLMKLGMENIHQYEREITRYALNNLLTIDGVEVYGPKDIEARSGILSFNVKNINHHDVANYLSENYNICIRSGHHCALPLMKRLGLKGTARASFYIYNVKEDVDILCEAISNLVRSG
jgi:cysteine desulfurase/selenocysteine lyase